MSLRAEWAAMFYPFIEEPWTMMDTRDALLKLADEIRTIQVVAGQCSVEGENDTAASMAAAEAERCRKWADQLAALARLPSSSPPEEKARHIAILGRLACEIEGLTTFQGRGLYVEDLAAVRYAIEALSAAPSGMPVAAQEKTPSDQW
jgi:hypothetical protein